MLSPSLGTLSNESNGMCHMVPLLAAYSRAKVVSTAYTTPPIPLYPNQFN